MKRDGEELIRYSIEICGIVQGVGFRPFVYNTASELGVKGFVKNRGSALLIDAEAPRSAAKGFVKKLLQAPPPLAQIERVSIRRMEPGAFLDFKIISSDKADEELSFIPKDIATCERCKRDIFDKESRWFGYAFTNCTDCGPRYSIIKELPYDRCNTSMGSFLMCPDCAGEYNDHGSRRFHAQPVCCDSCGPKLQLLDRVGRDVECSDIIKTAVQLLKQGSILAVKGIGGFHLMCDAENEQTISMLRSRKGRPHKPLAVMMRDLDTIRQWCDVEAAEEELLQSPASPIVLLDKRCGCSLPEVIAPDTDKLGVMLPYSPLHHLMFKEGIRCMIATSGNVSGAPIEFTNEGAVDKLSVAADYFLLHNRDINIPVDDSVVRTVGGSKLVSRLGRGYAPLSLNLGIKQQLAALGAEEKAAFCLSKGGYIYMSQYLGDLKNLEAYQIYRRALENLKRLAEIKPTAYIHDLHPDYLSTCYAMEQPEPKIAVQHHFAHMLSCMAENRLKRPAIGVIYDGTGYGEDGRIWGGEFLVGDYSGYARAGQLRYMKVQGGDRAVLEPWRTAASYMQQIGYRNWDIFNEVDENSIELVLEALRNGLNCHETSSMGRLFDCVASMVGLCSRITYDAQGAIRLEKIVDASQNESYNYSIYSTDGCLQMDFRQLLAEILQDVKRGKQPSEIAGRFHYTVTCFTIDMAMAISRQSGIKDVVLSGGCFENRLLLGQVVEGLERQSFKVYFQKLVPCNDGGISLGQLAAANRILRG